MTYVRRYRNIQHYVKTKNSSAEIRPSREIAGHTLYTRNTGKSRGVLTVLAFWGRNMGRSRERWRERKGVCTAILITSLRKH